MSENDDRTRYIESQVNHALEPRPSDEVFNVLEKLARLSEKKYIFTSYPAANTQGVGLA